MKTLIFIFVVLLVGQVSHAAESCGSSITVKLPPPRPARTNRAVKSTISNLACLAERARYKCTPVGPVLKGIGSYYGKGDEFTAGKTVCEKPFKPQRDKILALQDSLIPFKQFRNMMCGRKAVIVAYEPDTGRCTSTIAELSDTGNLGAKDVDGKSSTRDILKRDSAKAGLKGRQHRMIAGTRIFDLSYAAAKALGYADPGAEDDGKAYMEVQVCDEIAPGGFTKTRDDL